jgi:membrane dipeptidase
MSHLIVDAHEDIAFNVLAAGRDYLRPAHETRRLEAGNTTLVDYAGAAMLGLSDWLAGRVAVVFATIFVAPARSPFNSPFFPGYETPDEARGDALRQLEIYRTMTTPGRPFRLVRDALDLDGVLAAWEGDRDRPIGLVLLMENGDAVRTPDEIDEWHEAGLRVVGPAWMASRYCGGTAEPGPLTDAGRALLDRMASRRMILDTSHMAEESFFQAVERYDGPVVASHSNPRRFVDGDRHLSDDMIRAIVARDGVIGQVPFNAFLVPGWKPRSHAPKEAADLATVVRAIDHVCDLAGSARHVGFGSDFDGGFGAESTPVGIDTVGDLQNVAAALGERGYGDEDVVAITHGNWLRVLRRSLPGRA